MCQSQLVYTDFVPGPWIDINVGFPLIGSKKNTVIEIGSQIVSSFLKTYKIFVIN